MKFNPAKAIHDLKQFGEFGDVNPSITDSSTYTFLKGETMEETFLGQMEGCFLYSRHWNPSNKYLADALAAMENTESAWITASGMAAITCALLQLCNSGDHIITSVTTYGGTYAFLKNWLPKYNIEVSFVNITNLDEVKKAVKPNTKVIYTESVTNPLLQVSNIPELAKIAHEAGAKLMVDNTFTPMIFTPAMLGADLVVYSMTKFINGKNDLISNGFNKKNAEIFAFPASTAPYIERTAEIVWPNRKSLSRVVENLGENLAKLQNLLDQGSQADIEKFLASASSLRTISDATLANVKNKQGNKVVSKIDNLVADFLKYSKSRVIASDFSISNSEVSYLVNEI